MKKNTRILSANVKIACFLSILFSILCLSSSMAQNDHFIYMDNGKFYEGCNEFYPIVMNYTILPYKDAQGEFHIMPHKSWCEDIEDCYSCGTTPSEFRSRIVNHLQMIISKGFNTIRLCGPSVSLKQNIIEGQNQFLKNFYYFKYDEENPDCPKLQNPGFHIENANDFHKTGDLIQDLINIIKEENLNLRVIILAGHHGVEVVSSLYAAYLSYLSDKFKDEPIIIGYDIYNEPFYENKLNENSYDKYTVAGWFSQWYGAIKENAPSHLVTYGPKHQNVIKWDAEIISVDFISYHPYPIWIENNDWNFDLAFSYYNCILYWFSDVYTKPWIIGETGYSGASDPMHAQYPEIGSYDQQETFAENSLNYNKWYGSEGYSWWTFKDYEWFTSSPNMYMGLSLKGEDDNWKSAADKFFGYIPSEECPTCTLPTQEEMMNPLGYEYLLMHDIVYDESNEALKNAMVLVHIGVLNPETDEYDYYPSLSITNGDGIFKIYYETDEAIVASVQIGYPGKETIIQENWQEGFTTLSEGKDKFKLLDPELIPEIPNYDNWIIEEGEEILWDNPKVVKSGDVEIKDGATLTIKSKVFFNSDAKLIVKRGGTLVLDTNALLTSNCNSSQWQGVEVRGNAELSQGSDEQGRVLMLNGATIENAVYGIRSCKVVTNENKTTYIDYNYTGGIVQASNAIFRNNYVAASFPTYPKTGYTYQSSSLLANCEFITDDEYMGVNDPDYFVKMKGINSVDITSCLFKNESSIDFYGNGLRTANARLNIKAEFNNLHYGIYAAATNTTTHIDVQDSEFIGNYKGLYISGMEGAQVTSNYFDIKDPSNNLGYGMYLDNCHDYTVEENQFLNSGSENVGTGLVINNSGPYNNEVYNNEFEELEYATLAQNCNRSSDPDIGLSIKCNDYWDNYQDIAVTSNDIPLPGIARNQGAEGGTDMQAGNRFSLNNNGNKISDYSTFKQGPINYFHHDPELSQEPRVEPLDYSKEYISLINQGTEFVESENCQPHESGGGGSGGDDREGLRSEIAGNESKSDSTQALLSALVDGGNTEVLQQEILQTMPPEAYDLYMSLMGKSPYLSDSVLIATIEKENILPNVIIKDILAANPQSAKSPEIMDKVEEKTIPMTEEMIAEILLGKYVVAAKEKLESQLSHYKHNRSTALKFLKQSFLNDTIDPYAQDSLIALLESEAGLLEKYQLVFNYMNKDNITSAENLLNSIPTTNSLNAYELGSYNDFVQMFSVVSEIHSSGIPVDSISTEMKQTLLPLADNSNNIAGAIARNILIQADGYEYTEPIILPEMGLKSSIVFDIPIPKDYKPEYINMYPNPAMNYIIVELNKTNASGTNLILFDNSGKIIKSANIPAHTQDYVLGLKDVKPGIYILKADMDGRTIGSKKFSIIN